MPNRRNNKNNEIRNEIRVARRWQYFYTSVIFLVISFGSLHIYHVSTMFENDRHFSHLSTLEREMTFRTEMGLYYSYYKTLVEAPTFLDGLYEITHDNRTEFPSEINTLKRFNLYPEVFTALLYRGYISLAEMLNFQTTQCWHIDRGNKVPPVRSCEGLGDPTYFYLEVVWLCAGLTTGLIFLSGLVLSENIAGAMLSVLCFFYNHSESTRVQWTPPLRESFAYPFCLLQVLAVTRCIRLGRACNTMRVPMSLLSRVKLILTICIPTWIFLLLWQFSQFVLTTQIIALFALYALGVLDKNTLNVVVIGIGIGLLHAAICLFINEFLIFSYLTCAIIIILLMLFFLDAPLNDLGFGYRFVTLCFIATFCTFSFKARLDYWSARQDDNHIINLLKSKLTDYKDFHTLLYTCTPEFDFMPLDYLTNISLTLLLPSSIFAVCTVFVHWWRFYKTKWGRNRQSNTTSFAMKLRYVCDAEVAYNILQLAAYVIMAALIMRLKLFLTPQLCLIVSVVTSPKYFRWNISDIRVGVLFLLIAGMSVRGIQNIHDQRNVVGEYSNLPMEEMMHWIKQETKPNAVFAGPMPVMANVLLSTRRPIVNHPHYEDSMLRLRTKIVYSIFSRKPVQEVYISLSQMQIEYVILEKSWCFRLNARGCSMQDIWDVEDKNNVNRPPLCPKLFKKSPAPFHRVFANGVYVVLQIRPQSQYVEIRPPKHFKQ